VLLDEECEAGRLLHGCARKTGFLSPSDLAASSPLPSVHYPRKSPVSNKVFKSFDLGFGIWI